MLALHLFAFWVNTVCAIFALIKKRCNQWQNITSSRLNSQWLKMTDMPKNHSSSTAKQIALFKSSSMFTQKSSQFQRNKPEEETVHISRENLSPTCLNAGNAFNCATKFRENKPRPIGIQWASGLGGDPFSLVTKSLAEETLARGEGNFCLLT